MRMRPDQVPEPPQPTRPVNVRGPGSGRMSVPVPVIMASAARGRPRIRHGIQDARNARLQHLHNSHARANANDPQPGQPQPRHLICGQARMHADGASAAPPDS